MEILQMLLVILLFYSQKWQILKIRPGKYTYVPPM